MPDLLVLHTIAEVRTWTAAVRSAGQRIGLVPTMGALHGGHLGLVDLARATTDAVIVSIFVNPTQFAPGEDLDAYPRTFAADCDLCAARGVAAVFAPSADEMYPEGEQTRVAVPALARGLCGASRPHFFGGVATIVLKLLNIVMADGAWFGEKDYQQLLVVRRMVADLAHPTAIHSGPTVRAPDGLALSSRNRALSPADRRAATSISRALWAARSAVSAGARDVASLRAAIISEIIAAGGEIDYVAIVDAHDLAPIASVHKPARAVVAARFGPVRLIDNMSLPAPSSARSRHASDLAF